MFRQVLITLLSRKERGKKTKEGKKKNRGRGGEEKEKEKERRKGKVGEPREGGKKIPGVLNIACAPVNPRDFAER